eukprot:TRINITY_DN6453_c0_g1_i3.p1 TRINITY_DN6453_c0_g1~~TRINITY_DN6453_c0_g1_i3.p1  ORF type:complete len:401 (-),score=-25.32 TRINITY_DN6453_c0_g1_i3:112-1314(-)
MLKKITRSETLRKKSVFRNKNKRKSCEEILPKKFVIYYVLLQIMIIFLLQIYISSKQVVQIILFCIIKNKIQDNVVQNQFSGIIVNFNRDTFLFLSFLIIQYFIIIYYTQKKQYYFNNIHQLYYILKLYYIILLIKKQNILHNNFIQNFVSNINFYQNQFQQKRFFNFLLTFTCTLIILVKTFSLVNRNISVCQLYSNTNVKHTNAKKTQTINKETCQMYPIHILPLKYTKNSTKNSITLTTLINRPQVDRFIFVKTFRQVNVNKSQTQNILITNIFSLIVIPNVGVRTLTIVTTILILVSDTSVTLPGTIIIIAILNGRCRDLLTCCKRSLKRSADLRIGRWGRKVGVELGRQNSQKQNRPRMAQDPPYAHQARVELTTTQPLSSQHPSLCSGSQIKVL